MKTIIIEISDAEHQAIETIAMAADDLIDTFVTSQIRQGLNNLKSLPKWADAVALAGVGADDWAVVAAGFASTPPLFETAAVIETRNEAAQAISTPDNRIEANSTTDVLFVALAKKIGLVNATRTDGGPDYPVTIQALTAVREAYTDFLDEMNAGALLGETLTQEQQAKVAAIRQGKNLFTAIDAAAQIIIQAGDVTNPIADDPRWPDLA